MLEEALDFVARWIAIGLVAAACVAGWLRLPAAMRRELVVIAACVHPRSVLYAIYQTKMDRRREAWRSGQHQS